MSTLASHQNKLECLSLGNLYSLVKYLWVKESTHRLGHSKVLHFDNALDSGKNVRVARKNLPWAKHSSLFCRNVGWQRKKVYSTCFRFSPSFCFTRFIKKQLQVEHKKNVLIKFNLFFEQKNVTNVSHKFGRKFLATKETVFFLDWKMLLTLLHFILSTWKFTLRALITSQS
jgi:hypothetical protein